MKTHVRLSVSPAARRRSSSDVEAATAPEPCKAKHRGNHHLFIKLQLWLAARGGLLIFALLLSSLGLAGLTWLRTQRPEPAAATTASSRLHPPLPGDQHRLLLATHNRLAWYFPLNDSLHVLHEGQGVHYGMFPGDPLPGHPATVWNLIRPHNWRPTESAEHLLQLDAHTGAELARVEVASRFGHDVIRVGGRVYVCSTGDGAILELSYPSMQLLRRMPLFSEHDHPNTLAAADADGHHLWVLLHNLGKSDLVKVYVGPHQPAHEVSRIAGVGLKAHGVVAWGRELLLLDSDSGALVSVSPDTGDVLDVWLVPEEGKFLKGLAVLDDIAYVGVTTWAERGVRDSRDNHGELAAFDLVSNRLLFRRTVPTSGLLNIIGAPHLAVDSTYAATYSHTPDDQLPSALSPAPVSGAALALRSAEQQQVVLPDSTNVVLDVAARLTAAGWPPADIQPVDYWSTGYPRLSLGPKLTDRPELAGLQLPLFLANVTALYARLASLPRNVWSREHQAVHNVEMTGRTANMDRFKPGVEGLVLLFSDNDGAVVYEFPYYSLLRAELEPLLLEILGPQDVRNIVRLQLARMAPGTSEIKAHQDSGGYARTGHRIHVPLVTHPLVSFEACPDGDGHALASAASQAGSSVLSAAAAAAGRRLLQGSAPQLAAPRPMEPLLSHEAVYDAAGGEMLPGQPQHPSGQHQRLQPRRVSAKRHAFRPCVKLPTPPGLVFELNNRVPHKVSNPAPSRVARLHLVIDVFESPRLRTPLPPGSKCEYGVQPEAAFARLQQLAAQPGAAFDVGQVTQEIRALLSSPGLTCVAPNGRRILPLSAPSSWFDSQAAGAAARATAAAAAAAAGGDSDDDAAAAAVEDGGDSELDELVEQLVSGLLHERQQAVLDRPA